jgi:glycine cleavage system H protein
MPATASPEEDRRYLDTHEWHLLDSDGLVAIGISRFAVDELTDITYLELSASPGEVVVKGDTIGEIESVKATSELYTGVDGELVEVNQDVIDDPALINADPYAAWILKLRPSNSSQLDALTPHDQYEAQHG